MIYDAVIVGGGAAGLFCSVNLAWSGKKVLVIEHSGACGKKLLITGKGRCNVTNNCDDETVMKNIPRNPRFMFSSLKQFSPEDTMMFFESLGVPLKTERGGRVFPVSDKAEDIVSALVYAAKQSGVDFAFDNAKSLIIKNQRAVGVKCEKAEYSGNNIVIATGGRSYPKTGSTGDGYSFAKQAGHSVTEITPSLCPIVTKEKYECAQSMGLSLKNCTLTLRKNADKKPVYSEFGEMLFTHFGLSGPLVLSASAHLEDIKDNKYYLDIDLKPALDPDQLDARILRDFGEFPNRDFINSLNRLLPSKIIPVIVKRSGIPEDKKVNQISKSEREELVKVIKKLTYTVENMRPISEAIITRGGVSVKEINPKTMGSKLCENLYFIGEVLDVDAYTGGFNLQIAFSTANSCCNDISNKEC